MRAAELEKWPLGELLARMNQDSNKLQRALANQVPNIVNLCGTAAFAAMMMVFVNPALALLGLFTTPIISAISLYLGKKVKVYALHLQVPSCA